MMKMKKHNPNETEEIKDTEASTKQNEPSVEKTDEVNSKDNSNITELKDTELQTELEKKNKEIETLTETMKRRQADFENYKKRMSKMQEEQSKLAIKDFALDVININDDLLRAFEAACNINREKSVEDICNTFSDGFMMISKNIEELLKKYGINEIDALNNPFDPNICEAVEMDENGNVNCDTVTKVHQKGFRLSDYVIRSAKVKVTKPKKPADNSGQQNDNNQNSESAVNEPEKTIN
ncbi:MAG: nucleotide exchange factor GrpE [Spirochaetota bacterium]